MLTDRDIPYKLEEDWKGEVTDQSALMHLLDSGCSCPASLGPLFVRPRPFLFTSFLLFFSFLLFSFLLSLYTFIILTVLYSLLTLTYTYTFHQIYSVYCILFCLDYSA